jgi:hypothetical protein
MTHIELPEEYSFELDSSGSYCAGKIYHPGIRHFIEKIGYFIANIEKEEETFIEHIVIELTLRTDLKYDSIKHISVAVNSPKGFAGPDKELLKELLEYQKSSLPSYSEKLPE